MSTTSISMYNQPVIGEVRLPGDKSISHRAAIFGAVAQGTTTIENFLMGEDCLSTLECLRSLGVRITRKENGQVIVEGKGWQGLEEPSETLYAGNSGTTVRLLTGVLAGRSFSSAINGDVSIQKRPMDRVTLPLSKMGADIESTNEKYTPLTIHGTRLKGASYDSPVASAQVKSAVLLAGLQAEGTTYFTEPHLSRDHTERMIQTFEGHVTRDNDRIILKGEQELSAQKIHVPGDISSAAFFIAAAVMTPDSHLVLHEVGVNPTRTGFLEILQNMGADIKITNDKIVSGEPIASIEVNYSPLSSVVLEGEWVPKMIDEIPIFALVASRALGKTVIRDAAELKIKETNRIATVVKELSKLGVTISETNDGMIIDGTPDKPLNGGEVESYKDHRIAMMLMVASQIAKNPVHIKNSDCINISFPGFIELFENVR